MTVRMYARRKNWPLDDVSVEVSHNKVHAHDAGPEGSTKLDQFTRTLHLSGALDEEQRARLLEIADKCPVHRTLEASANVVTELKDSAGFED